MAAVLFKWLLAVMLPATHPFHVSTTEINHNEKEKTLEVTCRIFTDDFEAALAKRYGKKADFSDSKLRSSMDSLVSAYIQTHLQIRVDSKALSLHYLGFEIESEAVFAFLEAESVATVKKIEVTNTVLYDLFDDQVSLIHVKVGGKRKSTKLDYPAKEAAFSY